MATSIDSDEGCVVCDGVLRRAFHVGQHTILECSECGHERLEVAESEFHVDRVYADSYFFSEGGQGYPDYIAEGGLLRVHGARYGRLMSQHMPCGEVLDVGCAAGFILKGFADSGWNGRGVEPNARMATFAREELRLEVVEGTLESYDDPRPVDLVLMIQVIGHFLNPRLALERAAQITRPGGHLLVESWDRSSWTARLFGRHWHEYKPPSVVHWFSRKSLAELVVSVGYELVTTGRPRKRISVAYARSLLRARIGNRRWGRALLRAISALPESWPIHYPGDDLFWALFRRR